MSQKLELASLLAKLCKNCNVRNYFIYLFIYLFYEIVKRTIVVVVEKS